MKTIPLRLVSGIMITLDLNTVQDHKLDGGNGVIFTDVAPPHVVPMIEYEKFLAAYKNGSY